MKIKKHWKNILIISLALTTMLMSLLYYNEYNLVKRINSESAGVLIDLYKAQEDNYKLEKNNENCRDNFKKSYNELATKYNNLSDSYTAIAKQAKAFRSYRDQAQQYGEITIRWDGQYLNTLIAK